MVLAGQSRERLRGPGGEGRAGQALAVTRAIYFIESENEAVLL